MFDIKLGTASLKKHLVRIVFVMLSLLFSLISSDRTLAAFDAESALDLGVVILVYHNGSTSLSLDCIAEF